MGHKQKRDFEEAGQESRASIISEILYFLKQEKKWWLLPIILVIAVLGILVLLGGSGAAPFIYPIF